MWLPICFLSGSFHFVFKNLGGWREKERSQRRELGSTSRLQRPSEDREWERERETEIIQDRDENDRDPERERQRERKRQRERW